MSFNFNCWQSFVPAKPYPPVIILFRPHQQKTKSIEGINKIIRYHLSSQHPNIIHKIVPLPPSVRGEEETTTTSKIDFMLFIERKMERLTNFNPQSGVIIDNRYKAYIGDLKISSNP